MTYSDELDSIADWPRINRPVKEIQDEHMRRFVDIDLIILLNLEDAYDCFVEAKKVYEYNR